jgi:hypothetical protein
MGFTEREYSESIGPERESVTVSHDLTSDSGVKVKLSRSYRSRLIVIDFSPMVSIFLLSTIRRGKRKEKRHGRS